MAGVTGALPAREALGFDLFGAFELEGAVLAETAESLRSKRAADVSVVPGWDRVYSLVEQTGQAESPDHAKDAPCQRGAQQGQLSAGILANRDRQIFAEDHVRLDLSFLPGLLWLIQFESFWAWFNFFSVMTDALPFPGKSDVASSWFVQLLTRSALCLNF